MTDKRLIDIDPLTGIQTWYVNESTDGEQFQVHEVQDVAGILEANKYQANEDHGGWSESRDFRKVGTIPLTIIQQWKTEKGIDVFNKDHWPAVKRLLNDSDWRHLRSAHWNV